MTNQLKSVASHAFVTAIKTGAEFKDSKAIEEFCEKKKNEFLEHRKKKEAKE